MKFIINKKIILLIVSLLMVLNHFPATSAEEIKDENNNAQNIQAPLKGQVVVIDLNSDKLEYFEDKNEFVATGSAEISIKEQNSKLEANKITYDQINQILTAEENVKLTKNGKVVLGKFARIDLANQSALIDDPSSVMNEIRMKAKTANIYPKDMEAFKGRISIDNKDLRLNLSSNEFSPINMPESSNTPIDPNKEPNYKIVAKEVEVQNNPDKNIITIKNATILIGKIKIASIPKLEFSTDKDVTRVETRLPEMGYNRDIGAYFGPSHVFYLPKGGTLKTSPIIAFDKNGVGGGGIARFTTGSNRTEIAYATVKDEIITRGEQNILSPYTKIQYGTNSYLNNGIFGAGKSKYIAELVDERKLASAMNMDFYLRSSAGYAQDYYKDFGTSRFQLQGNLFNNKPLLHFKDYLYLGAMSQFDISVYGNGDTFGVLRGGPILGTHLGPITVNSVYFQAGVYGESPFIFDRFVQGKSNLILNGNLKICKYIDVGNYRNLNLTKDNWEKKLTTENQIFARVGPEDFKIRLGYDTIRKRTTFGVDLLVGSGRTAVDFDKLKVIQPEDE